MEYKSGVRTKKAVFTTTAFGGLFVILIPLLWLFLISIKSPIDTFNPESFWRFTPTFDNYFNIITNSSFQKYFFNSFIVSSISLAISMFI